ncbi:L-rhamnose-binding lectin CSL3-like [Megalobrama amblycephala]|uniref:L-rhamnose-binding lectin CSL3-like n=1 Tax=Megalobrama amblycephala TaxID=75352 RepID=UPI002014221B|nr:L-rhamnose-binding lectin CSL3-like [Megalobrama amblycephala]
MLPCSSSREFLSFPLVHTFNMLTLKLSGILLLLILCQHGIDALAICEGENGSISCRWGSIRVIRATYGRTDRTTCAHGKPTSQITNTNCRAPVTQTISSQCNKKKSCVVSASNSLYSDPCVGTYKYLDVTHICLP